MDISYHKRIGEFAFYSKLGDSSAKKWMANKAPYKIASLSVTVIRFCLAMLIIPQNRPIVNPFEIKDGFFDVKYSNKWKNKV